jgi:hypothetical protein
VDGWRTAFVYTSHLRRGDSMLEGKTVSIHDQHPSVPFHVKRGEGGHQVTKRTC